MKENMIRKLLSFILSGGSVILIGLLLIPIGVIYLFICFIWNCGNRVLRLLEAKKKS